MSIASTEIRVVARDAPPPAWSRWLVDSPDAGFFHTTVWMGAVCRHVPGASPLWLIAERRGDSLGALPIVVRRRGPLRVLSSHHEGTAAGPLLDPALAEATRETVADRLLRAFAGLGGRPTVWRATLALPAAADRRWAELAQGAGLRREAQPAAVLPLVGGLAHVEMHVFKKNRRNERNRSLRRGCTSGVCADPALLEAYYPIYLAAARRWAVAPTPLPLLRDLLCGSGGSAFLSWVRHRDEIIGAHLCFHHGREVVAWNGATSPAHHDLFPATLLVWTDIVEACRREATRLDLGGSAGIGSLLRFKELLGAELEVRGFYTAPGPWQGLRNLCRRLRSGAATTSSQVGEGPG